MLLAGDKWRGVGKRCAKKTNEHTENDLAQQAKEADSLDMFAGRYVHVTLTHDLEM